MNRFSVPVDICDHDGKVLARVVPSADADAYEVHEPVFDEAELRKQETSGTWYSNAQVFVHLRGLERTL